MKRIDAKRVKDYMGMEQISIDLKPSRAISTVYCKYKMDVTELHKYIEKKKKDDMPNLTYFHAFLTGLGRVIYHRPKLNRFVANRHIWEHNTVSIAFVAKIAFNDRSEELMNIVPFNKTDNIRNISDYIYDKVHAIREGKAKKEGANNIIDVLGHLPNIIRVPIVEFLKWLDRIGKLPKSIQEDNLYYSSMIVSNLGTLKCDAILHNINDFGTASIFTTMGEVKEEEVLIDGKKEKRLMVNFGVNLDERVADGFYFIKSIKMLQYLFDHPELLEEPMQKEVNMPKETL